MCQNGLLITGVFRDIGYAFRFSIRCNGLIHFVCNEWLKIFGEQNIQQGVGFLDLHLLQEYLSIRIKAYCLFLCLLVRVNSYLVLSIRSMSSKMEETRALELVALLKWKRFLRAVAQNCLMHLLAFGQKFARKMSLCMCLLSSRAFYTMYSCWGSLSVVALRYKLMLVRNSLSFFVSDLKRRSSSI